MAKKTRTGIPLTVYFRDDQMNKLNVISQQRHVAKSDLLRLAVDLLLDELNKGQLELKFGVQLDR